MSLPSTEAGVVWVQPNLGIVRALGWINSIGGAVLLLFALCGGAFTLVGASTPALPLNPIEQDLSRTQAERAERLDNLAAEEAAAADPWERQRQGAERKRVELEMHVTDALDARPLASYQTVYLVLVGIGAVVLNAVLLASGVGLLRLASWGRMLALGYAVMSLSARCVSCVWYAFMVDAVTRSGSLGALFIAPPAGGMGPTAMAPGPLESIVLLVIGAMLAVPAIAAVCYAIVLLWLLTRPAVRAAFRPEFREG